MFLHLSYLKISLTSPSGNVSDYFKYISENHAASGNKVINVN